MTIKLDRNMLVSSHFKILASNLLLPLFIYVILSYVHPALALVGFITAIAPTAAGAPVIASFLKCKIDHVTASVLISSIGIAVVVPLLLPQLIAISGYINVISVLFPVAILIFGPLIIGQLIKHKLPSLFLLLNKWSSIPFFLFVLNIYIATSKATDFIKHDTSADFSFILQIGLLSGVISLINFSLGYFIGGKQYSVESSLGLGRKNTMFAIWLSLSFINPLTALGPIFYIFFQNLINSFQIFQVDKQGINQHQSL